MRPQREVAKVGAVLIGDKPNARQSRRFERFPPSSLALAVLPAR